MSLKFWKLNHRLRDLQHRTQYTINGIEGADAESFLAAARPQVVSLLGGKRGTKVSLVLAYTMQRVYIKSGQTTTDEPHFCSMNEVVLESTDVNEGFNGAKGKILEAMASFQMRGSNWRRAVNLDINIAFINHLKA